jgi:hypothetical protein
LPVWIWKEVSHNWRRWSYPDRRWRHQSQCVETDPPHSRGQIDEETDCGGVYQYVEWINTWKLISSTTHLSSSLYWWLYSVPIPTYPWWEVTQRTPYCSKWVHVNKKYFLRPMFSSNRK